MDRKRLSPQKKKILIDLALRLAEVQREVKASQAEETSLKSSIHNIVNAYNLPGELGKTQYLEIPGLGKRLNVVRPEKSLSVDPEKLLARIGPEKFHRVCRMLKAELNLSAWDELDELEEVTDEDLLASLPDDAEKEPSLRIGLASPPKNEAVDDTRD